MSAFKPPLPDDVQDAVLGQLVKDVGHILQWISNCFLVFVVIAALHVWRDAAHRDWVSAAVELLVAAVLAAAWHDASKRSRRYRA